MSGSNQVSSTLNLGEQILKLYETLYAKIPTTLWISDLHGDGERFIRVLQGRFGMLYTTCQDAIKTDDDKLIKAVTQMVRQKHWSAELKVSKKESLLYLLKILRYKLDDRFEITPSIASHSFAISLLKTSQSGRIPNIIIEDEELFSYTFKDVAECIQDSIPDKIILLGDIFDRGDSPDKIVRILRFPYYRNKLSIVWGNHDILWLGACAENKSMIAQAIRVTYRYSHVSLLKRLDIDTTKLEKFAHQTYPQVTGNFKPSDSVHRSVEKALVIIQFKLEEEIIKRHPEYHMDDRLWLNRLLQMLNSDDKEQLTDTHFPTISAENPQALTAEEQDVIDDLAKQFKNSKRLKSMMELFITEGKVFNIYQNFLNIHALIPSTAEGDYDELFGHKGRKLLEYIQSRISIIGQKYLNGEIQDESDSSMLFYLWCGPKSPLFGKTAMKTFERYFLKDKQTHKETTLHWNKNISDPKFQQMIKRDFNVNRIIFGHTPRDVRKGDKMSIGDGFAINIDGGFAGAYLERGHALVRSPHNLYGIVLPTAETASRAINEHQSIPALLEWIEKHDQPLLIGDISESEQLHKQEKQLLDKLKEVKKKAAQSTLRIASS